MRNSNYINLSVNLYNILLNEKRDCFNGVQFSSKKPCKLNGWHSEIRMKEWFIKDKNDLYINIAGINAITEKELYLLIKYNIDTNKINLKFGSTGRISFKEFESQLYQLLEQIK